MMKKTLSIWLLLALLSTPVFSAQTTLKVAIDDAMDGNAANSTGEDWRLTDFENWAKQHNMNSELYNFQGPWTTGKIYAEGVFVAYLKNIYVCMADHTAGTFATDLAAVRWKFWGSDIYAAIDHNHTGTYEPAKGSDDNYVTDAQVGLINNAQPSLGTVGTAGKYFIEENVLGVTGKSIPGTWKMFYTDGAADGLKELSIGSIGAYLKSNGTGGAPTWDTPSGAAHDAVTIGATPNGLSLATQVLSLATASTSTAGASPQATAPAAGLVSVLGIANGETVRTDKPLFDATAPSTQAYGDAANVGTATVSARRDHKHAMPAAVTDATISQTDVTTGNASTTNHGWLLKATAPASGLRNLVGIDNAETVYTNKALFDATSPTTQAFGDSATVGTAMAAARRDHKHAMPAAPTSVSGNAGSLAAQYIDWNSASGGSSIANKPTIPSAASDTAYDATSWDGVTTIPPSKNAVRDYLETKLPSGTDGTYGLLLSNNTARTPTATSNELYPEANVWKVNQNGTESSIAIGPTGTQINFSGTLTDTKYCTYGTGGIITCNSTPAGGLASTDIDTSLEIKNIVIDETGSGALTFATSPAFTTDIHAATAGGATAGTNALPFSGVRIGNAATNNILLTGTSASDVTITLPSTTSTIATLGANTFTGTQALGANSLTMTGSIAATGARVTKGWFTDIESTNAPTVGGVAVVTVTGTQNIATTGTIQGGIVMNTDANGMTGAEMTTAGMYGTLFIATGAGTWTLPTAVAGMSGCLKDTGTSHDLILDVQAADNIQIPGAAEQADGIGVTNAATATVGDMICFAAISSGHWVKTGSEGAWVSQ